MLQLQVRHQLPACQACSPFFGQQLTRCQISGRPAAAAQPLLVEAKEITRRERRKVRHQSVRKKVKGLEERPRLSVFRSHLHIYAQVIDDTKGDTLVAASTLTPDIRQELTDKKSSGGNKDAAVLVGKKIAELCKEKGVSKVCFDRGGFIYHGRVQALADAAREGGLIF